MNGVKRVMTPNKNWRYQWRLRVVACAVLVILGGGAAAAEEGTVPDEALASIVIIKGDQHRGTGFLAKIREVDFVVTNLHVIGGNDEIDLMSIGGVRVQAGRIFGAVGRDLAIVKIGAYPENTDAPKALATASDLLGCAKIGDRVIVMGNSGGGGVATHITGKIRGIGPDRIEVDAPFEPGNSGSPIIHLDSGLVVGVATYQQVKRAAGPDGEAEGGGSGGAKRWFGYRLDAVEKWETIDLARWRSQEARIVAFREDSMALRAFAMGKADEAKTNPRFRAIFERFERNVRNFTGNRADAQTQLSGLIHHLTGFAQTGVQELKSGDFYDYFRSNLYWEFNIPAQLDFRSRITTVYTDARHRWSYNATGL